MRVIIADNLPTAYHRGLTMLSREGEIEESRAGRVLVMPEPVTTVYERPDQRVLLCAHRDANPFFHLAESMWMLSGASDAEFLTHYVRDFADRFAEVPEGEIHDAYGRRWRWAMGFDQLKFIIKMLRHDPTTRQCVLQMWDVTPQHYTQTGGLSLGENDLAGVWKTRPCNTHAYFRLRVVRDRGPLPEYHLDMMISCRSNDVIWGAYGANAVHFSLLQEYVASMVGAELGTLTQVSWNYHAYLDALDKVWRDDTALDDRYEQSSFAKITQVGPDPLVQDPTFFDVELATIVRLTRQMHLDENPTVFVEDGGPYAIVAKYHNRFLSETYWPAITAARLWRLGRQSDALFVARLIHASDWRAACVEWIERRLSRLSAAEAAE